MIRKWRQVLGNSFKFLFFCFGFIVIFLVRVKSEFIQWVLVFIGHFCSVNKIRVYWTIEWKLSTIREKWTLVYNRVTRLKLLISFRDSRIDFIHSWGWQLKGWDDKHVWVSEARWSLRVQSWLFCAVLVQNGYK